ncbi:hypothetical protein SVIRM249S_06908 [Streptomyces viridochromogenes]
MLGAGRRRPRPAAPYLQPRLGGTSAAPRPRCSATGLTGAAEPGRLPGNHSRRRARCRTRTRRTTGAQGPPAWLEKPKTYTLTAPAVRWPRPGSSPAVLCTDGWRVDDTPFEGVRLSDIGTRRWCALPARRFASPASRRRVRREPRPGTGRLSRPGGAEDAGTSPSPTSTAAPSAPRWHPCTSTSRPSGCLISVTDKKRFCGFWEATGGYAIDGWPRRSRLARRGGWTRPTASAASARRTVGPPHPTGWLMLVAPGPPPPRAFTSARSPNSSGGAT